MKGQTEEEAHLPHWKCIFSNQFSQTLGISIYSQWFFIPTSDMQSLSQSLLRIQSRSQDPRSQEID